MGKILKHKTGFILKNIAGDYIVVPTGKNIVDFKMMLTTNQTGAWIWEQLEKGIEYNELVNRFAEEFDIDIKCADKDVNEFILQLENQNLLEI